MAYLIKLTRRAEQDLARLYLHIEAATSDTARRWYLGLRTAIRSLAESPDRCPSTPETNLYRHLLYGRRPNVYRIVFRIIEKKQRVEVLHIRHGARNKIS